MKWTLALSATLGLVMGCSPGEAGKKQNAGETSSEEGAKDKAGGEGEPAKKLSKSGDKTDQDSPDSQFFAEQFVLDGFETDDAEAFSDETALALLDEPADDKILEGEPEKDDTAGSEVEKVTDANEVEDKMEPATDEDPTANDKKLSDLIAEFMMGLADKDGDGLLAKPEFVDARYFPKLDLPEDVLARIKERRGKVFDQFAGEDAQMSQDELIASLDKVGGAVKKLRMLRFLPYADHLAKAWKVKKADFDADGDGKLGEEELAKLRAARQEEKKERRSAVLASSYGLCQRYLENGKTLPEWFDDLNERWQQKMEKHESFADKFGGKFHKKPKGGQGPGSGMGPGSGTGEGPGSGTGEGSGSGTGEGSGSGTDASMPPKVGAKDDPCGPILDRAQSFGMSDDVVKILKERGVIQP